MQALGHHRLLFRWSSKTVEEFNAEIYDSDAVKSKFLKTRETDNAEDSPWWRQCANLLNLSLRDEEAGFVPDRQVVESTTNAIYITVVVEKEENSLSEVLNLFQNALSLHVYHEFLEYIFDKFEKKQGGILALSGLNASIITVVQ